MFVKSIIHLNRIYMHLILNHLISTITTPASSCLMATETSSIFPDRQLFNNWHFILEETPVPENKNKKVNDLEQKAKHVFLLIRKSFHKHYYWQKYQSHMQQITGRGELGRKVNITIIIGIFIQKFSMCI